MLAWHRSPAFFHIAGGMAQAVKPVMMNRTDKADKAKIL
jgi:hypothetical protein